MAGRASQMEAMPRSNAAKIEGRIDMPLCKEAKYASKTENSTGKAAN